MLKMAEITFARMLSKHFLHVGVRHSAIRDHNPYIFELRKSVAQLPCFSSSVLPFFIRNILYFKLDLLDLI